MACTGRLTAASDGQRWVSRKKQLSLDKV
jgi:hypothetical protein